MHDATDVNHNAVGLYIYRQGRKPEKNISYRGHHKLMTLPITTMLRPADVPQLIVVLVYKSVHFQNSDYSELQVFIEQHPLLFGAFCLSGRWNHRESLRRRAGSNLLSHRNRNRGGSIYDCRRARSKRCHDNSEPNCMWSNGQPCKFVFLGLPTFGVFFRWSSVCWFLVNFSCGIANTMSSNQIWAYCFRNVCITHCISNSCDHFYLLTK